MSTLTLPPSQLPWATANQDNQLFNRLTWGALALTLALALVVSIQQLPEQPRAEKTKLPPQLARILKPKPPAPAPVVQPEVKPQPKAKPEPEKKVEAKPEPKPEPVKKVEPKPEPKIVKPEPMPEAKVVATPPLEPKPEDKLQKAREQAQQSGLLAFQDDLASLRSDLSLNNMGQSDAIRGGGEKAETQRKRIGKEVTQGSGGVSTAGLSSNIGSSGDLAGRKTTEFVAPNEGIASLAAKQIEQERGVIGDRDLESIRQVLDANKGAIYSLYRRALRQNPSLQGKMTVQLVIEPSGEISTASILDSELGEQSLEQKLLTRIRLIQFGAAAVTRTQLDYAFNFLPF